MQVGDGRVTRPWHVAPYLRGIASTGVPAFIADSTIYHARIRLMGRRLSVYCDTTGDLSTPLLSVDSIKVEDLVRLADDGSAFMGFTSATGFAQQRHELLGISIEDCDQLVSVDHDVPVAIPVPQARIVPLPAQYEARLELSVPLDVLTFGRIFDVRGVEVATVNIPSGLASWPLPVGGLRAGMYRLQYSVNDQAMLIPFLIMP